MWSPSSISTPSWWSYRNRVQGVTSGINTPVLVVNILASYTVRCDLWHRHLPVLGICDRIIVRYMLWPLASISNPSLRDRIFVRYMLWTLAATSAPSWWFVSSQGTYRPQYLPLPGGPYPRRVEGVNSGLNIYPFPGGPYPWQVNAVTLACVLSIHSTVGLHPGQVHLYFSLNSYTLPVVTSRIGGTGHHIFFIASVFYNSVWVFINPFQGPGTTS